MKVEGEAVVRYSEVGERPETSVNELLFTPGCILFICSSYVNTSVGPGSSSKGASLARSSHLPRTASKLFVTRCEGAHLLVFIEEVEDPVGLVRMLVWELLRERALPPPLEDVRSSNLVWYAKGPDTDPGFGLNEPPEVVEFERSISLCDHQCR